jgi:hypothetical protein
MDISLVGNSALRLAIQRNLVSFPSQIPPVTKRPRGDLQERMAQLYFARGWEVRQLCARYSLSKAMVQKILSGWRIRAVAAGFIQDIHPEDLDVLIRIKDEPDTSVLYDQAMPASPEIQAGDGWRTPASITSKRWMPSESRVVTTRAGM